MWPEKTEDFFKVYHNEFNITQPFFFIKEEDSTDSEYSFGTSNGTKVRFDNKGNWYNYERSSEFLTNAMYEAWLPKEMRKLIEQKYGGDANRIHAILRHEN